MRKWLTKWVGRRLLVCTLVLLLAQGAFTAQLSVHAQSATEAAQVQVFLPFVQTEQSSAETVGVKRNQATAQTTSTGGQLFLPVVQNAIQEDQAVAAATPNLLANAGFETSTAPWQFGNSRDGAFTIAAPAYAGTTAARVTLKRPSRRSQLFQQALALEPNTRYKLSFVAFSSTAHALTASLQKQSDSSVNYGLKQQIFKLTTSWQAFSIEFTTRGFTTGVSDGQLAFRFAPYAVANDIYWLDEVVLQKVTTGATATPTVAPTNTPQPATPTPASTSTNTPLPPTSTATSIPTNTPANTATPTPLPPATNTATSTPLPATSTPLPTATSTPLPATPTPLPTATSTPATTPTNTPSGSPAYPLKLSANGHYLVDQNNAPFLLKGDSAQAMIGALSEAQAQTYLTSRAAAGFNTIWTHILCGASYSGCNPDGSTYDGLQPFTTPNDLSTPNPAYFSRVDHMLQLASQAHLLVFASPIETINWLSVLRANGTTKAYNYGVYLGNRYKNVPNLVWFHGNDFQTWSNASDDAVVRAVAEGIKAADPNHLQTVELNYDTSGSLDDPTWSPLISIDAAYSYYPQYAQVLKEYNRASIPIIFWEGVYEYQDYMGGYLGPYQLRNQEYWAQLSGASGQLYGHVDIFRFPTGWQGTDWQTSPGVTQFGYWAALFKDRAWYSLVPDQQHTVVTAGYGTFQNCCVSANSDYLTAARTPDGKLVIAYLPTRRTITVDMTKVAGPVTARWYDPTTGTYSAITGSPFANTGSRQFTPSGNNNSGDGDWVLVLETP